MAEFRRDVDAVCRRCSQCGLSGRRCQCSERADEDVPATGQILDTSIKGKNMPMDPRIATIKRYIPNLDLRGKPDAFIEGAHDVAKAMAARALQPAPAPRVKPTRKDAARPKTARERMIEREARRWREN